MTLSLLGFAVLLGDVKTLTNAIADIDDQLDTAAVAQIADIWGTTQLDVVAPRS